MFYDKFVYLCKLKGVAPTRAATDAGISKSLVTKWRTNNTETPSPDVLRKLSAYFNTTVAELLGEDVVKETPQDNLERKPNRNVIKIAGRDGSFKERILTDEQLAALAVLIDQLPDVPDDL